MVLLSINFLIIVLWVWAIRNRSEGWLLIAGLCSVFLLLANVLLPYKEIRREPTKFVQVEWEGKKYEGLTPAFLNKVEAFTPEPHFKVIHSSLFGIEIAAKE